jgi:hypothetical protein
MEVVSESKSGEVFKKFDITSPQKIIKIKFGPETERTLQLGSFEPKSSEVYFYLEEKPFVYKSNPSMFSGWSVEPKDYEKNIENKANKEAMSDVDQAADPQPAQIPSSAGDHQDHNH